MIEKNVEAAIITAIENLGLPNIDIVGLWQPTATGIVKATEKSNSDAALVISIPPKSFDTFGICEVSLEVSMTLTVRVEKDATGSKLLQYVEPINAMLESWNMSEEHDELEALITEDFYPGGIRVNAGSGPTWDPSSKTWSVEFSFTVRGLLQHEHN